MDITSQTDNQFQILESELRENYGKIVYSHKTQERCADILTQRNKNYKNLQIILAALITTGLLIKIFKDAQWAIIVSTILSALQFGLTTYLKEYNLGETIQKHSTAALELLEIRERYLSLLTDIRAKIITIEKVVEEREKLLDMLTKTYKGSPRTFSKAYKEAQHALQINEELTFSEDEINKFLPTILRNDKS